MNFGQAIESLKNGSRVVREGWNGKGMWLHLVDTNIRGTLKTGESVQQTPYIEMKTADNKLVPWLASQTDMLAEDWEIVDELVGMEYWNEVIAKDLTFEQADAIAKARPFSAITRPGWIGFHYYDAVGERYMLGIDGVIIKRPAAAVVSSQYNDWQLVNRTTEGRILVNNYAKEQYSKGDSQ